MGLGSIIDRVVPVVIGAATGGLPGAYAAASATEAQKTAERRQKARVNEYNAQVARENQKMAQYYDQRGGGFVNTNIQSTSNAESGFGAGFGTFLSDVGRNIVAPISSIARSVSPFFGSRDAARQPATTRSPILQGTELQNTGQNEAFVGGFGNVIGAASRFLRSPAGSIGTGLGLGGALSMSQMPASRMRITRRTKRLAQQAYALGFGNLSNATVLFAQLSGLEVSEQEFVLILTKRFRNDGPVVTKAALRKTKTTINRLKNMCDMYDSLRKAPVRRRTPMKRASTTLISNK